MAGSVISIDSWLTFKNPCTESSSQGYHSDGSNDGYFSCKESLPNSQLDHVGASHQVKQRGILEGLIRERVEFQKIQKRIDSQLGPVAKLVNQVLQNSYPQGPSIEDTLDAVTLRSRTQLKGPPLPAHIAEPPHNTEVPETIESSKEPGVVREKAAKEPVLEETSRLPYPSVSKKQEK
ncbi:hypothetical protein PIB30_018509 [Stylosanthes scabra]|uniref:Uncharacterized protein n=1 Tax=Stylosanthes scabra TaxID=79078 RepID=A0ABU6X9T1_9FABA|nr:hypothetical protein [Stylosanthes scabra]